ncbi:5698_t:CDS:2 [Ambispora leptoticha]|uniref:5698_t:CDS:1 n=1 Tax=Ambispora leptoticha TaxID=144679 RepID=A0A9N8Z7F9_9GLOM|nr:5698_t:CDS:2 [Ambispora leptoticha]
MLLPLCVYTQATKRAIEAYFQAGQQLRYVSQVIGELQALLPPDMCIKLPPGLLNEIPPIGVHDQTTNNASTAPLAVDFNDPHRNINIIESPQPTNGKSSNNSLTIENELKREIYSDEEEEEDELYPSPPLHQSSPVSSPEPIRNNSSTKRKRKSKQKDKIYHHQQPYETVKEESRLTTDQLYNNHEEEINDDAISSTSSVKQRKPKHTEVNITKIKYQALKRVRVPLNRNTQFDAEIPPTYSTTQTSPESANSSSQIINNEHTPQTPEAPAPSPENTSKRRSSATRVNNTIKRQGSASPKSVPLTDEQNALVDEFVKYLEPRLEKGEISQKGIANEIRERSGHTCQIVQGTISKMVRRIAVPKEENTIAAIRNWIEIEKGNRGTSE